MNRTDTHQIAALILAAGEGKRFGGCKQLAPFGETTVLQHTVNTTNQHLAGHIYVVTGAYKNEIEQHIRHAHFMHNPEWHRGLGSSIACGLRAIPHNYDAILILLADQVGITARGIALILQTYQDNDCIVCARYASRNGVPALFPQRYFSQLTQLSGDQGAKKLLKTEVDISILDMPEAQWDIDTTADLDLATQHKDHGMADDQQSHFGG